MATCPKCKGTYPDDVQTCPEDGETLLPDEAFANADEDLLPGATVGEYVVEEKLGEGGFGAVFSATHPLIGKQVAIKVLYRQYSTNPQMVSRFIAEARAVNQIRHNNIVDIFSFGTLADGRQYYIMELLGGLPLDRLIEERGRVSLGEAILILRQLARALDAAHAKGIAHRDLKPENVFVGFDDDGVPQPKLLDFGIAKLMGDGAAKQHKTRTGAPLGTPYYMSPEQCRGREVDHRTDIYSFGVLCYQMLTGQLPFDGDDFMEILFKQLSGQPVAPSQIVPELSAQVDQAIGWMMEKEAAKRPPTLVAAVRALEEAAGAMGIAVPTPMTAMYQSQPATRTSGSQAVSASERTTSPGLAAGARATPRPPNATSGISHAQTLAAGKPVAQPLHQSFIAAESSNLDLQAVRGRGRTLALVVGVAVLVLGGGIGAMMAMRSSPGGEPKVAAAPADSAKSEPAVAPTPPPQTPQSSAVASAPAADPTPATVTLKIKVNFPPANVYLDGKLLGTLPGTFTLPSSGVKMKLEIKKGDYDTYKTDVTPSDDVSLDVPLVRHRSSHRTSGKPHDKEGLEEPDWTKQ